MSDYMKEAERLIEEYGNAEWKVGKMSEHSDDAEEIVTRENARAALLAHIQRGAVPEGDDGKRVLREVFALCEDTEAKCHEDPSDFNRGRYFEAKGIARAIGAWYQEEFCGRTHMGEPAASAPDQFRDAVAAPAEVPMPEPYCHLTTGSVEWMRNSPETRTVSATASGKPNENTRPVFLVEQMQLYGDDREAAGYARGLAEAGRDAERYRTVRFLATAERDPLPEYAGDTSSPDAFDASIDHATAALRGEVKP